MQNVELIIHRLPKGFVQGFTLQGVCTEEAQAFCLSLITAMNYGKGKIDFRAGQIVFNHEGVTPEEAGDGFEVYGTHKGGDVAFPIDPADEMALRALVSRTGVYEKATIRIIPDLDLGNGFTVRATSPQL